MSVVLFSMKKIIILFFSTLFFSNVSAEELPDKEFLKVCADPYMLPFSNQKEEGYENKIAQLFAEKLGLKLKYEFFPQRMGFVRNTLRAESEVGKGYKCDLIISAPNKFELAATTEPYFTSTYVLVFAKGRKLDGVTDPSMLRKYVEDNNIDIKIGLADRGPAQLWVFYNELMSKITPYQGQPGDPKSNPGKTLIDDIVAGKIDASVVWGPTAGYFAQKYKNEVELVLMPLSDVPDKPEMKFTYSFSMAVRYGEKKWKDKINQIIKENQAEIDQILTDYGVPLVK